MWAYLLGWISGYVILQIYGENKERFLNLALQKGIEIYDINWLSDEVVEAKVNYHQIGALRKIGRVTHCPFKIRTKKGLPFCYQHMKRRKMLAVGLLLFCAGFFALSSLSFAVKVVPQEELVTLDVNEVAEKAAVLGVKPGAWISRLDFTAIEKQLKKEIPELSWVAIERRGTLLKILVAEREIYPEEENQATIGAIWSDRDALVESVLIKHGQAMVQRGDTVTDGQLLVAPLADGRADAIIQARVWYEGYGEGALREAVTKSLGEAKSRYYLTNQTGTEKLWLWGSDTDQLFAAAATNSEDIILTKQSYQPELWPGLTLPFVITKEMAQPQLMLYQDNTETVAKEKALQQAKDSLEQQTGPNCQLLQEEVDYQYLEEKGVWSVRVRWECLEEIGVRHRTE